ncbi:olfactory receptor 2AT4-like [Bombina bombina]|uniref:olfactory receptor 2AT4-like n=1 Tax=Bombina bombina TaxID=8345 RepID=UPI00235ADB8F|nr:olfactory receptor 2AT4-like [Bombina bombina]
MANQSAPFNFVLVGFPGLPQNHHTLVSSAMFVVFIVSLFSNSAVVILIVWKKHLHEPMYVIIANLSLSDLLFDIITLPKIIARYWFGAIYMSFFDCMFQLFWVHYLGTVDSFIIMMMAIDRYAAICMPLRYPALITNKRAAFICGFFWILASIFPAVNSIWHAQFPYCDSRKISNCFCVSFAVTSLACGNTNFVSKMAFWFAMAILLLPLSLIISSYIVIINTVFNSVKLGGRQKAIYTCTTHLIVIGMYYGPRVFVYVAYQLKLVPSLDINVLLLFLYTFIPHMANPIIYCLRAREIKQTIGKLFKLKLTFKIEGNFSRSNNLGILSNA